MKGEYRIVVSMDGTVCVQRHCGGLMTQYHPCYLCKEKDEEGLAEAKQWIEERTKEGGEQ